MNKNVILSQNKTIKMNFPEDLKYTKEHEWVKIEGNIAIIGITEFAQKELGDIVYLEIETLGETIEEGEVFGTVEAVKTVSDLFMPVTGKIVEINKGLDTNPEHVNLDAYGKGWMIKVELTNVDDSTNLMSADQYASLIG
jgi:glycine cleavage system H protein